MPRRRLPSKRKIKPDPKFQDRIVAKFMNDLMRKGKKSTGRPVPLLTQYLLNYAAKKGDSE